jgi:hypothetical protein
LRRLEFSMSEAVTLPPEQPIDSASDATSALPDASTAIPNDRSTTAPVLAHPLSDARALLELIASALAPDADEATRTGAREALAQLAQPIATTVPVLPATPPVPGAPAVPGAPLAPAMPVMPTVPPPSSPIVMAARALRGLPPEQLLDIALQRLRAALPAGTTVAPPKGIQFQLVPVAPPPSGSR